MNKTKARRNFAWLQEDNPTPTTELAYSNPFELLMR